MAALIQRTVPRLNQRYCQSVLHFCSIRAMIDWDDLRFVLAVARAGSALAASRVLKVNQTTVMRRIAHLEETIGTDLLEGRQSTGYALTPLGQDVAAAAARIESEVTALESTIAARQRLLSGSVRLTSNETIANRIVAPCLREFRKQHPGITVELINDDRRFDIARNEADVAYRAGSRPEGAGIVARRLPDFAWAIYCSRGYADEHGTPALPDAADGHAIIDMEGAMSTIPAFLWLTRVAPKASISARSNSLTNLLSAVKAGLGIGPLPCFVGDAEPDLLRCCAPIPEAYSEAWLIIREDLKQAPHVRAFADFLAAHVNSLRSQISCD